jgi:hypothetical protein
VAELQVDALAGRLRGDADLLLGAKFVLDLLPAGGRVTAVDGADRVAPVAQMLGEILERVAVFGEDQQLAVAVQQLRELSPGEAVPERRQLPLLAGGDRLVGHPDQLLEGSHLDPEALDMLVNGHLGRGCLLGGLVGVVDIGLVVARLDQP